MHYAWWLISNSCIQLFKLKTRTRVQLDEKSVACVELLCGVYLQNSVHTNQPEWKMKRKENEEQNEKMVIDVEMYVFE